MARKRATLREGKAWAAVQRAQIRRQQQRFDAAQAAVESAHQRDREDIAAGRLKQEDLHWLSAEFVHTCTIQWPKEYIDTLDKRQLRRLDRQRPQCDDTR